MNEHDKARFQEIIKGWEETNRDPLLSRQDIAWLLLRFQGLAKAMVEYAAENQSVQSRFLYPNPQRILEVGLQGFLDYVREQSGLAENEIAKMFDDKIDAL